MTSDEHGARHTYDLDPPAVERALEMPRDERQRRMDALRTRVHAADAWSWIQDQLRTVEAVGEVKGDGERTTAVSSR